MFYVMFETTASLRPLALVGIVGPIVWWLLIIVNGALTPEYSHISDFISTLGAVDAPYAPIQTINFAVFGGSILALMLGIHYWFDAGSKPRTGTVLLGVFGVGVILAGIFPEHTADPDSMTNVLHNLTSTIAFVAGILGVGLISRRIVTDDRWPSYRYELIGTIVIVSVTFAGFMLSIFRDSAFVGLTQRLFIGVMTLWLVMQSYRLYRLVGAPEPDETGENRTVSIEGKTPD